MSLEAGPRNNLIGAFCALTGAACFSVNDMMIKFISADYALHQVVFIRAIIGVGLTLIAICLFGAGLAALRTRRPGMHALRALCILGVNTFLFLSLAAIPMADALALFFVAPLLIAGLSFTVLGERVGPWRWAAVAIGLVGVVVMLRPGGAGVQIANLLPLGAALSYATLSLLTRHIGGTESAQTMAVYTQMGFIVVGAAMWLIVGDGRFDRFEDASLSFLLRAWVWPAPADWPIFLGVGAASAGGAFLISQAYRMAEVGLAAPFEYVALPMAVVWGVLIFGDFPDAATWTGMALIAGGGLLLIWREAVRSRTARALPPGAETR